MEYHVDVYIRQGPDRTQHIIDWSVTQDIDWGSCFPDDYCILLFDFREFNSPDYQIYGDEDLELIVQVTHPGSLWTNFTTTEIYSAPGWGAGGLGPGGGCGSWPMRDDEGRHSFIYTQSGVTGWWSRVDLCRENYGE